LDKTKLYEAAIAGKDAEEFFSSSVGKYLLTQVSLEREEMVTQLLSTNPWRKGKINKLQAEIKANDKLISWISELITTGHQAIQLLEDEQ
jgi:hypothetical protein